MEEPTLQLYDPRNGDVAFRVVAVPEGLDPTRRWTGLEVLGHGEDWVEFVAHHEGGAQHERSRFERRAGRWVYVEAVPRD